LKAQQLKTQKHALLKNTATQNMTNMSGTSSPDPETIDLETTSKEQGPTDGRRRQW